MKAKEEKPIRLILTLIFAASILLLTVPTFMVVFYEISKTWFIILNTLGLILATFRVVLAVAINVSIHAVKGEKTGFKKKLDVETWILFSSVLLIQMVNLMFVHFE